MERGGSRLLPMLSNVGPLGPPRTGTGYVLLLRTRSWALCSPPHGWDRRPHQCRTRSWLRPAPSCLSSSTLAGAVAAILFPRAVSWTLPVGGSYQCPVLSGSSVAPSYFALSLVSWLPSYFPLRSDSTIPVDGIYALSFPTAEKARHSLPFYQAVLATVQQHISQSISRQFVPVTP